MSQYQPPQYGQAPQYGHPQQQQQPQMHQAPSIDVPNIILPDAETLKNSHRDAESDSAGRPNIFKVPPPVGKNDWRSAPINSEQSVRIWLCPSYEAGRPLDHFQQSHFVQTSSCRGMRFRCEDPDKCVFCIAYNFHKDTCTKAFADNKLRFCKRQKERMYSVLNLDNEAMMQGQDGRTRPLLATFSASTHVQITEVLQKYGASVLHPVQGRPFLVTKKKFGPTAMNVTTEIRVLDPQPLPQHLWFLLAPENLWKLHALVKDIPNAQAEGYLRELGISLPGGHQSGFNSYPAASPMASPTPQTTGYHSQMAYNPPPQQTGGYNPPPQQQQAQHYAEPPPNDLDTMPAWDQPGYQSEPPPQKYPSPQAAPPYPTQGHTPPVAPSYGQYAPTAGAPPARQSHGHPGHSPAPHQTPAASEPSQSGPTLVVPLAGDIQLPDGRERCFGKHDPQSHLCATCPPWIKNQCLPQTPQTAQSPQSHHGADPAKLAELQKQLTQMKGQA